jgi:exodeoxyribonuclease V gamma subunit
MLTIHHSNRLEKLAEDFAALTRTPLASPFAPEVVVVQSRGIARWLSLRLADHCGVCANFDFAFPSAFAWTLYRSVLGSAPETSAFDPAILAWRILRLLPALESDPAFAAVRDYVGNDAVRRYELAVRVATLFDQYSLYRPDWMPRWEKGSDTHWQAILWRELAHEGAPHRAELHAQLLERLAPGAGDPASTVQLPERLSFFGAPALPPSLLALFQVLGHHADVHLFLQNPCREYWGDIRSAGDVARRAVENPQGAALLDIGNGLLASLGRQGRDAFDLLAEIEGARETESFIEPGERTLLAALQSDILNLRDRTPPMAIAPDDHSVQVHACHSAMREVEVLHDRLLALFSENPDLEPSDIVVMAPDIETYAPYIEAVFGTTTDSSCIPFSISDRSAHHESTVAATFSALLDLAGSRYEANRVLALLDEAAVRARFGLTEGDRDTITRWVREAQIRWGIDAAHRARLGLPATSEHTWRFGLERLLLGYALPARGERLFAHILPYDEVEGSLGDTLGRFASFAEGALAIDAGLSQPRPLAAWAQALHALTDTFFDPPDERLFELEAVRDAVDALAAEARTAGLDAPVPLAVVKSALRDRLRVPGRAFLSGGVTFCAMVPMRSLPFDVVCMIGMNDGAFPRMQRPYGFDLMAEAPRKGDRSRRADDRYLFLESLSCARRCLYMSYVGRNIRDDSVIPPSVLVSELIDYIAEHFRAGDDASIRDRLVTVHPLQAFSARYFRDDDRLFSYSKRLRDAAVLAGTGEMEPMPFIRTELPPVDDEFRKIDLESLIRFFRNPARYLLRERLNVRLETAEEEIDAREPFALDGLTGYAIKQRLLERKLRGETADTLAIERAGGALPHGRIGEILFERERGAVEAFFSTIEARVPSRFESLELSIELSNARVSGVLGNVSREGVIAYRPAKVRANDRIAAWVRHLALNAMAPQAVARTSCCIGEDVILTLRPVADAVARLEELVELYFAGLIRPLHFFPRTACVYFERGQIDYVVKKEWEGSTFEGNRPGECEDPYYRIAFRGVDPLDAAFEHNARVVFGPMKAALEEEALA